VPANVAKSLSVNAVLNSAVVPVKVLSVRSIDLFVRVETAEAERTVPSTASVKSLPEIVEVIPVPPKILNTSPFAETIVSVELSSWILIVPFTVVPSPIAV